MVTYHVGDHVLSHEAYMRALGVPVGATKYPGYSADPLHGFRHLAADIAEFGSEFLSGDARVLLAHAPIDAEQRAFAWRVQKAGYVGDTAKRSEALTLFRRGEYSRVVALLESLQDPALLNASECRALVIARQRASQAEISHRVV